MMNGLALEDFVYVCDCPCMCNLFFLFKLQKINNIPIVSQQFSCYNDRFSLYWFVLEIQVIFLYVCIFMPMCMYTCICIYVYVCIYMYISYVYVCICKCVYVYIYVYIYVCMFVYACMRVCIYICIFKVRFSLQVFDLICTNFAVLGRSSQHFLNFTIFLKLGTALRSITGNPQKIWSRHFAKKSIIGSYQESQSMRGMVNSRTLVKKT